MKQVQTVLEASTSAKATQILSLTDLVEAWAAEVKPTLKTIKGWRGIVKGLVTFLEHNDAAKVTRDDIIRWKDVLVARGLASKTINDSKLAPVSAILRWAVNNAKLTINPADNVRVKANDKGTGIRGFDDKEASLILTASSKDQRSFIKWLPWLGAMTGARISELSQLRGIDVFEQEGIPVISIQWDAGNLKNNGSERKIPIHPKLGAMPEFG